MTAVVYLSKGILYQGWLQREEYKEQVFDLGTCTLYQRWC